MFNEKIIYAISSFFAFVFATATTTDPQQGTVMVVHNASNFYAAEGSIAVKGGTLVASADGNASVLTVFNSTPPSPQDVENQYFTSDLNASARLKTSLPKPRKHTHKTTTATAAVEKPVAQKTTVACPFGNYPTHSNSFYALHNGVAITPSVKSSKDTSKYFIKTSTPASPDLSGGEFSYLSNYLSTLWRELVPTGREVRGEVTTRPPPPFTT